MYLMKVCSSRCPEGTRVSHPSWACAISALSRCVVDLQVITLQDMLIDQFVKGPYPYREALDDVALALLTKPRPQTPALEVDAIQKHRQCFVA
jgi:hypothetical protein